MIILETFNISSVPERMFAVRSLWRLYSRILSINSSDKSNSNESTSTRGLERKISRSVMTNYNLAEISKCFFDGPEIKPSGIIKFKSILLNHLLEITYIKKIGVGGQGEVWEAILFGQKVAVKKITTSDQQHNFIREIINSR